MLRACPVTGAVGGGVVTIAGIEPPEGPSIVTPSRPFPARTFADSATSPPTVLDVAFSITTPLPPLARGGGPQDRDQQAGESHLGADLVVGHRVPPGQRVEDMDAVPDVARDQVAHAREAGDPRLADVVVGREQEHAVAAVIQDEVGLDRVARPLGAVDDARRRPCSPGSRSGRAGSAPPIRLFGPSIRMPTPLASEFAAGIYRVVGPRAELRDADEVAPDRAADRAKPSRSRKIAAPLNPVRLRPSIVQPRRLDVQADRVHGKDSRTVDLDLDAGDVRLLVVERVGQQDLRRVVLPRARLRIAVDDDRCRDHRQDLLELDRLQTNARDLELDVVGRGRAGAGMVIREDDRVAERAQRRSARLVGDGRDEERVDRLDRRSGEFGRVAGVPCRVAGIEAWKFAVAVTQSPVVTTTGTSTGKMSVDTPLMTSTCTDDLALESVRTVVAPISVSPSTRPCATPPGVLKNWSR